MVVATLFIAVTAMAMAVVVVTMLVAMHVAVASSEEVTACCKSTVATYNSRTCNYDANNNS